MLKTFLPAAEKEAQKAADCLTEAINASNHMFIQACVCIPYVTNGWHITHVSGTKLMNVVT